MRERFYLRLEPTRPAGDPQRGFVAELADPAWMLGRQWQMGEHQGEDASSPLAVRVEVRHVPIEPMAGRPGVDPQLVPAEAIVESTMGDWWTIGRRVRLGLAADRAGVIDGLGFGERRRANLRFKDLTGPYEALNGVAYDGQKVYKARPRHPVFAEVPPEARDLWASDLLAYVGRFPCAQSSLEVGGVDRGPTGRWGGHDGGDLDWWSVDAVGALEPHGDAVEQQDQGPDRFRWPGAPASRWWQIEDHDVDLGGVPPDRAHFATMLLLDLVCGHADDWFLVPISSYAGRVLRVERIEITDSFGETWPKPEGSDWRQDVEWKMFRVEGMTAHDLPIWPTAAAPLVGDALDEVTLGVDEDANLVWAVEERLDGAATVRQLPETAHAQIAEESEPPTPAPVYRYTPMTAVPNHWYPYTREEDDGSVRYVQGRLVALDFEGNPKKAPLPQSSFLQGSGAALHAVAPWRLPPTGVRLESRRVLARTTEGNPVTWIQRRRKPLLSTPASNLRMDALIPGE